MNTRVYFPAAGASFPWNFLAPVWNALWRDVEVWGGGRGTERGMNSFPLMLVGGLFVRLAVCFWVFLSHQLATLAAMLIILEGIVCCRLCSITAPLVVCIT